jgi:hypothetical protein
MYPLEEAWEYFRIVSYRGNWIVEHQPNYVVTLEGDNATLDHPQKWLDRRVT